MQDVAVNYLAIFVSAIVAMVIGMIWYSPGAFGKKWMVLAGRTEADMMKAKEKGMTTTCILAFVGQLVTMYVFAHIIAYTGAVDVMGGLQAGFWVWLGFIATGMLSTVLWEGKPWALYAINVAHCFVLFLVTGAILATWR